MRWRMIIWLLPLLVWTPGVWGQGAAGESTPEAQYKAIVAKYQAAKRELDDAVRAAKTSAEKQKLADKLRAKPQEALRPLLALAQKHPKSEIAFNALEFVLANAESGTTADKAADLLLRDHLAQLGDLFDELATNDIPAVEKVLRGAMANGPDKRVKAQATLALGKLFQDRTDAKAAKEAEDLFSRVVKEYADQKDVVQEAEDGLFVLRNLVVGRVAPDIVGEDGAGKKLKLSDFRGKVVVLDFWAGW